MELVEAHKKILQLLQADSSLSLDKMAEALNMSSSTLWRRLQELEAAGVITERVALIDPTAVGLTVCAFVYVNIISHSKEDRRGFEDFISQTPEVVQCFAMTGTHDYHLMVRVKDIKAYEHLLMERILANPHIRTASSSIVLKEHKLTTRLPIT